MSCAWALFLGTSLYHTQTAAHHCTRPCKEWTIRPSVQLCLILLYNYHICTSHLHNGLVSDRLIWVRLLRASFYEVAGQFFSDDSMLVAFGKIGCHGWNCRIPSCVWWIHALERVATAACGVRHCTNVWTSKHFSPVACIGIRTTITACLTSHPDVAIVRYEARPSKYLRFTCIAGCVHRCIPPT